VPAPRRPPHDDDRDRQARRRRPLDAVPPDQLGPRRCPCYSASASCTTSQTPTPIKDAAGVAQLVGDFIRWVSGPDRTQLPTYNFTKAAFEADVPGLSAFALKDGIVHDTYSCYARGLDAFNAAYQLLDRAPHGRDEDALPITMAWVGRHDEYESATAEKR
jgi:hypothetical protein